jgi:hypothetical protein
MWKITDDLIENGKKVGTSSCDFIEAKNIKLKHRFRLLDVDGEVYYEGLSDDCDSQRAFAPLDDFGCGYAGCSEIHYLTNGAWSPL